MRVSGRPASDQVTASIHVGTGPTALADGFGSVWVANSLDGTVSRIDPHTNTVTATSRSATAPGGLVGRGRGVGRHQYAGTVSWIDPVTGAVARTITVGNLPQGLALAGGLLWVGEQAGTPSHRGGTLKLLTRVCWTRLIPCSPRISWESCR